MSRPPRRSVAAAAARLGIAAAVLGLLYAALRGGHFGPRSPWAGRRGRMERAPAGGPSRSRTAAAEGSVVERMTQYFVDQNSPQKARKQPAPAEAPAAGGGGRQGDEEDAGGGDLSLQNSHPLDAPPAFDGVVRGRPWQVLDRQGQRLSSAAQDRRDALMERGGGRGLPHTAHASNLLLTPGGDVLLAWFSGGEEGGNKVGIVVSRLPAGRRAWTAPVVASMEAGRSAQNPVLFLDGGTVVLLHASQAANRGQGTAEVRMVRSEDGGATWGAAVPLFTEDGAFTKNQLLRSGDGAQWLLPMYYTPEGFFAHESQYSVVKRSADLKTWEEVEMAGTRGKLVQPSVVRLGPLRLRAFFRSRDADHVYASDSADDGKTWGEPWATVLPNNNSGIQAAKLRSGNLAIVFNNLRGDCGRWPLTIALSGDDGATFFAARDLEPTVGLPDAFKIQGPRGPCANDYPTRPPGLQEHVLGQYSYPSIVQDDDGLIHVSYTFRKESIRYVQVTEAWVRGRGGSTRSLGLFSPVSEPE